MRRNERGAALLLVLLAIAALWAITQTVWMRVQIERSAAPSGRARIQAQWLARSAVAAGRLSRQVDASGVTYSVTSTGSRAKSSAAVARTPGGAIARVEVEWSEAVPVKWTERYDPPAGP